VHWAQCGIEEIAAWMAVRLGLGNTGIIDLPAMGLALEWDLLPGWLLDLV
jgi:hypothetical protein